MCVCICICHAVDGKLLVEWLPREQENYGN